MSIHIEIDVKLSWSFPIQINESLQNLRHCKLIFESSASSSQWLDAKLVAEEATEATWNQKHRTFEGNVSGNVWKCQKRVSTISIGDADWLPVIAKQDVTAQAIPPQTAKETNQEDFLQVGASWAKKTRQWRHNSQTLPILPVLD